MRIRGNRSLLDLGEVSLAQLQLAIVARRLRSLQRVVRRASEYQEPWAWLLCFRKVQNVQSGSAGAVATDRGGDSMPKGGRARPNVLGIIACAKLWLQKSRLPALRICIQRDQRTTGETVPWTKCQHPPTHIPAPAHMCVL